MKAVGVVLMIVGVTVGLYMGVWWAFIGGIVDFINAVKAEEVIAIDLAISIAKVLLSAVIGWIFFAIFAFPGAVLYKD